MTLKVKSPCELIDQKSSDLKFPDSSKLRIRNTLPEALTFSSHPEQYVTDMFCDRGDPMQVRMDLRGCSKAACLNPVCREGLHDMR